MCDYPHSAINYQRFRLSFTWHWPGPAAPSGWHTSGSAPAGPAWRGNPPGSTQTGTSTTSR